MPHSTSVCQILSWLVTLRRFKCQILTPRSTSDLLDVGNCYTIPIITGNFSVGTIGQMGLEFLKYGCWKLLGIELLLKDKCNILVKSRPVLRVAVLYK